MLPQGAYVTHQLLIAGMHDVQVGKTQLVEFGHQMAVEGRAFRAFVDPPHRYAGGQANGGLVRADFLGNGRGNFDGETGPVRDRAAIFVSARVGAWGEELLDEIAVRAVNLDAIGAGFNGAARRKAEVGNGIANFIDRQCPAAPECPVFRLQ